MNDTRATGNNAEYLPKGLYNIPLFLVDQFYPLTWPSNLSVSWPYWPIWSPPFSNRNHRHQSEVFLHHFSPPLPPNLSDTWCSFSHSFNQYLLSTSSGCTKVNETMPWPWRRGRDKVLHYSTVSVRLRMHTCCRVEGWPWAESSTLWVLITWRRWVTTLLLGHLL